jgi:16S rRNA (uracil1498-N3)-methyltransferase
VPRVALDAETVTLPDDEAHHLVKVLRLRPGDRVAIFDGDGHEWHGTLDSSGRSGA